MTQETSQEQVIAREEKQVSTSATQPSQVQPGSKAVLAELTDDELQVVGGGGGAAGGVVLKDDK